MEQIHIDDTPDQMAKKIFNDFELLSSCNIIGFTIVGNKPVPKGQVVCNILTKLDREANTKRGAGTRIQRKNIKPKDSIGGYAAHKIFRFKMVILNDEPKYTIWRIQ